ncbi:hypothetical protein FB446DRAFT_724532 [Lentinula raphanica]|nr:hypothetical protein FB446DRAFT_724532 [Lentinula raphanica]
MSLAASALVESQDRERSSVIFVRIFHSIHSLFPHHQRSTMSNSFSATQAESKLAKAAEFVPILDDQLFEYAGRLKDKVVIITGAANGIGKESAMRFASFGAKIVIGDLDVVGAEKTVAEIRASGGQAVARRCNVTVWEDQEELFELAMKTFGSVDVVVPNAGITETGNFLQVQFDKSGKPQKPNLATIQVNLVGVLYTVHLAQHYLLVDSDNTAPTLKAIVLIGSMASWQGIPNAPNYSAAKHGVLGLMRSLEPDMTLRGIRIACITPFFADTGIVDASARVLLAGIPLTPVPRIAGAIIYAASHPDPATSGSGYALPDDGPVYQVPKEVFKMGVYKLLDSRLKNVGGIIYVARLIKDIAKLTTKPLLASALVLWLSRAIWQNRVLLQRSLGL